MKRATILVLTLALAVAGCLVNANIFVQVEIDDFTADADVTFKTVLVDLNSNSDYTDNKEDILSTDDLGFVCTVVNTGTTVATCSLWVSHLGFSQPFTTQDPGWLPGDAVLVLADITVAAGATKKITLDESYQYLKNFEAARDIILRETFKAYFKAPNVFTVDVNNLVLVLSVNTKS